MSTRIKEHKSACRLGNFEKSEHAWQDGHSFEWDNVEILDTAMGFISRHTKEAAYIKLRTTSTSKMNRDEGRPLSVMAEYPERCHQARSNASTNEPSTIATTIIPATPPTHPTPRCATTHADTQEGSNVIHSSSRSGLSDVISI